MVKSKQGGVVKSPRRNIRPTVVRSTPRSETSANIQVVVRVRPPIAKESQHEQGTIRITHGNTLVFDPKEDDNGFFYHGIQQRGRDLLKRPNKHMQFAFDRIFDHTDTNKHVFEHSTKSLVQHLMDGYNCSVFVYGATGAGKTYTMLGKTDNPGITPLTMSEMFRYKETLAAERDFELGITYVEVYNEMVQDLLNPGPALQLREDSKYGVVAAGINVKRIENAEELFGLLEKGNQNRTQHPTDANAESSRSHAIFQLYLKMTIRLTGQVRMAKLSMIDLAGSERGAATGYSGARFTEGANINKSLLALGNCINSLADGHRHVPYRDSKLTRLLKDSLGGNCRTVMIANVSPSVSSYEDTYNTLKYAMRAKKIKSTMTKNVISDRNMGGYAKVIDQMTQENSDLKCEIARLRSVMEELNGELVEKNLELSSKNTELIKKDTELLNKNSVHIKNIQIETGLEKEVAKMFKELKEVELQLYRVEFSENLHNMKRLRKEEIDARLSILCFNALEKDQGRKRLRNAVDRIHRQNSVFHSELTKLKDSKEELLGQIRKMKEDCPYLVDVMQHEHINLTVLLAKSKEEQLQRVCDLLRKDLRCQNQLMDHLSRSYQSCYLQLCGHGYVTDSMKKDHIGITSQLKGMHNVTWDNDLGVTNLPDVCSPAKKKVNDIGNATKAEEMKALSPLDNTFIMPSTKEKAQPTVANSHVKGFKPMVRPVIKKQSSPHFKEQKSHFRARPMPQFLLNRAATAHARSKVVATEAGRAT